MILVDTSVLIDYLKGTENTKTRVFENVLNKKIPYGIPSYSYQELLQGAWDDREFGELQAYLSTQKIYFLPETPETYLSAAQIFYTLRRKGVTVRSTIDVLIALMAIHHHLLLLHNDKDFDAIKMHLDNLEVLEA